MKYLIFGGSGMAGHIISLYLIENGHDVTVFSRKPISYSKNIVGDAFDAQLVRKTILLNDFDVVVNCIGVLNDNCETDIANAVYLNSYFPHSLVNIISKSKIKLIHLSTDCVFSGKSGHYSEHDMKDGESIYDRTKSLGELVNLENVLTFRNSIIGPDINNNGIGLMNWFLKNENKVVTGYSKAIWNGVTTLTLAKAIEYASTIELSGLYHLVPKIPINKHDLLVTMNKGLKRNYHTIVQSNDVVIDKSLVNNRTDFDFNVPTYKVMIEELNQWIIEHNNFYPHYSYRR